MTRRLSNSTRQVTFLSNRRRTTNGRSPSIWDFSNVQTSWRSVSHSTTTISGLRMTWNGGFQGCCVLCRSEIEALRARWQSLDMPRSSWVMQLTCHRRLESDRSELCPWIPTVHLYRASCSCLAMFVIGYTDIRLQRCLLIR